MAIDSAAKRASACRASLGLGTAVLPIPDAVIDQGDRATVVWTYRDLSFAAVIISTVLGFDPTWLVRRRR